jgi:AraC-like DNA-binding protein
MRAETPMKPTTPASRTSPTTALLPWVAEVVTLDPGGRSTWVHEPDSATALVFRMTAEGGGDIYVAGPRTRAAYHTGKDVTLCLKMRIRPGVAGSLLGVPVGDLVDRVVPLNALWGAAARRLERDLGAIGPAPEAVRTQIEAALLARLSTRPPADLTRGRLLRAAAEALVPRAGRRPEPVPSLARRLAVSERHLRDLFIKGVGVPPKRFARIERIRTVLANAGTIEPAARLAAETGYYDQSHMTAEFRTVMGVPPGAYFAGRLPAARSCANTSFGSRV